MKINQFKQKIIEMGYWYEEEGVSELIIFHHDSEWSGFAVANVLLNEEYGVHFDYCVPFSKDFYDLVYEFIKTPLEER